MADLIDRAPMLEFLDLQHYDKDMYVTQYNPEWIYSWLESQPAADVAPVVHGCWIEYTKVIIPEPYNKWEQAWKCSECGFDDGFVAYNFCPNCGTRMDLEVTDNG